MIYGDWLQEDSREGFMVSWRHPPEIQKEGLLLSQFKYCHAAEIYQCHFTAGFKYSRMKHILNANLYTIQAIQ